MNEVTLLQVKTQWSTLKEFDWIIQTQNCEINTLQEKEILSSHKINYINFLFLNYTIQLTRACSSITRVSWFASACVRTQSIAAHRIYVTAMRVARTFVDV